MQLVQRDDDISEEYVPAEQLEQFEELMAPTTEENWPARHLRQAAELTEEE